MLKPNPKFTGFTLLEILLVVAAISILAGIVIFAINPAKQLGDTRNAQRKTDVNTILNAVHQYAIDHAGTEFPGNLSAVERQICRTGASSCTDLINLSALTTNAKYLVSIPIDPNAVDVAENTTEYSIYLDSNKRVHVKAPEAENGITIEVIR